jgi:hypothetical protein
MCDLTAAWRKSDGVRLGRELLSGAISRRRLDVTDVARPVRSRRNGARRHLADLVPRRIQDRPHDEAATRQPRVRSLECSAAAGALRVRG